MLNDILHISLKRYLIALEEDHASNLLATFVEDNEEFFKSDIDINVIIKTYIEFPSAARISCNVRRRNQYNHFTEYDRR